MMYAIADFLKFALQVAKTTENSLSAAYDISY